MLHDPVRIEFHRDGCFPVIGDRIGHIATGAKALIFVAEHSCGFENRSLGLKGLANTQD
jgi:hypothetical protein